MTRLRSFVAVQFLFAALTLANPGAVSCDNIRVNKQTYDLSKLDAPHTVWVIDEDSPPAVYNTSWTVNICSQLKIDKQRKEQDQCKAGTNSKHIQRTIMNLLLTLAKQSVV
jgi:autophagy-related protein 27